jgi:class 3 adenylate cyclase
MGHATLGLVGFEGRTDYTALGNVVNLAARLCSQAGRGQIIVDRRIELEVRADVDLTPLQPVTLKGFAEPVPVFELVRT